MPTHRILAALGVGKQSTVQEGEGNICHTITYL
jgi:hypothetical protein